MSSGSDEPGTGGGTWVGGTWAGGTLGGEAVGQSPGEALPPLVDNASPRGEPLLTAPVPLERYEDLGPIGRGGMGEVRRVRDLQLGRQLAMKIILPPAMERPDRVHRFLEEARATAALQHPGIVPVHECGALADGRLWFTMKEVRGRTLREVIDAVHDESDAGQWVEAAGGWTFRRLVDTLRRVCEAVGFAHSRGVLHRDLKPENVMVGEHGEVLVLDWGLARDQRHRLRVGEGVTGPVDFGLLDPQISDSSSLETRQGAVMGTPAYMAPEQANGLTEAQGPATDVFALGMVLFEMLTGRQARSGSPLQIWHQAARDPIPAVSEALGPESPPVSEELLEICRLATAFEPEARIPDASALARGLADWLDGARREAQARELLARAEETKPVIARARARAEQHRLRAARLFSDLAPWSPVSDKAEAWAEEDAARALEAEALASETAWLQQVRAALEVAPDLPDLHAALAHHYAAELRRAELRREPNEAVRAEAFLRQHDRGHYAHVLSGLGAVSLVSDPPGALVHAWRMEEQQRRLVPVSHGPLGRTPLHEAPLPHGSWLLTIEREGHETVRYPISIGRGEHWDGCAPGESEPHPIRLPLAGSLAPDDCLVPAGWFWSGGDPDAADGLPLRRLWVDALVVKRTPVTLRQYLAFLDDLVEQEGVEEALRWAPRPNLGRQADTAELEGVALVDGRFELVPTLDGRIWTAEHPATLLDWHAARRFSEWSAARSGLAWRLPNELEWEKAARGVDGRRLVWGDTLEPTWANVLGHSRGDAELAPVGSFPEDRSIYGVLDLMGNVRDRCCNLWKHEGPAVDGQRVIADAAPPDSPTWRSIRGGSWTAAPNLGRPTARFADLPDGRYQVVGFRLFRAL